MKRFDYWCEACEHKFEELVRDGMIVKCPKCLHSAKKLVSAPVIMGTISDSKLRESLSDDFY